MKAFSFLPSLVLAMALVASTAITASTDVYVVTGVKTGEFLNMRSGAGTSNAITGRIPHNGQGIVTTGEEKNLNGTIWAKIYWQGVGGWVSKRYLLPEGQAANPPPPTVPPVKMPTTPPVPSKPAGSMLVCSGTEPFWQVNITDAQLSINMMDGPRYSVPITFRQTSANNTRIAVIAGATGTNSTQAFMQKVESCSDGMSDVNYPYAITTVLNNRQVVSGCCKAQ